MWTNPYKAENLFIFTKEVFKRKLHFFCSMRVNDHFLRYNNKKGYSLFYRAIHRGLVGRRRE